MTTHISTGQCGGCKIAGVAVRRRVAGYYVGLYDDGGEILAMHPCDTEDEARTVAALAAQAHGAKVVP